MNSSISTGHVLYRAAIEIPQPYELPSKPAAAAPAAVVGAGFVVDATAAIVAFHRPNVLNHDCRRMRFYAKAQTASYLRNCVIHGRTNKRGSGNGGWLQHAPHEKDDAGVIGCRTTDPQHLQQQ